MLKLQLQNLGYGHFGCMDCLVPGCIQLQTGQRPGATDILALRCLTKGSGRLQRAIKHQADQMTISSFATAERTMHMGSYVELCLSTSRKRLAGRLLDAPSNASRFTASKMQDVLNGVLVAQDHRGHIFKQRAFVSLRSIVSKIRILRTSTKHEDPFDRAPNKEP